MDFLQLLKDYSALLIFAGITVGYFYTQRGQISRIIEDLGGLTDRITEIHSQLAADIADVRAILVGPPDSYQNNGLRGDVRIMKTGIDAMEGMYRDLSKRLDGIDRRLEQTKDKS